MARLWLFALALLIGLPCHGADKIYKWVDKNGKVQYGDASDGGTSPESEPKKPAARPPLTSRQLDDQAWNRAVERAEKAPTGSSARNISGFAEPERSSRKSSSGVTTYQYSRNYPSPGQAAQQAEAERRYYEQQKQQTLARENQRKSLIAECERNRGTDCNDERTLQYMESANRPRAPR